MHCSLCESTSLTRGPLGAGRGLAVDGPGRPSLNLLTVFIYNTSKNEGRATRTKEQRRAIRAVCREQSKILCCRRDRPDRFSQAAGDTCTHARSWRFVTRICRKLGFPYCWLTSAENYPLPFPAGVQGPQAPARSRESNRPGLASPLASSRSARSLIKRAD